jgi:ABC-2 type transport system ATP-binding protein
MGPRNAANIKEKKEQTRKVKLMEVFTVEHLEKAYGKKRGASDVSFSIYENEVFGMVGPNGAGKTTTIECSLGIRKRDSGKVQILGFDPLVERNKVFARVGIQLQETSYPDKARVNEICKLMSSLYSKPVPYGQLLKEFALDDKKTAFISDLSGGQRQRLAIILALVPDPKIVVFDELTTGLDPHARRSMWKYIQGLKSRGITVLLTTHFMEEAEVLCDRIAVVVDGRIKHLDRIPELIDSCSLKSRIEITADSNSIDLLRAKLTDMVCTVTGEQNITINYENTHSLLQVVRAIDENNVSIRNLNVKTPTLEDAYLELTAKESFEAH